MPEAKTEKAITNKKELRELGRRIKEFRADNGMSATLFAEKASLSTGPILMLENRVSKLLQSGTRDKILKVIDGGAKPAAEGSFACSEAGCEYVGKHERALTIHVSRAHGSRPAKKKTRSRQFPMHMEPGDGDGRLPSKTEETRRRMTAEEAVATLTSSEEGRSILAQMRKLVDVVQKCRDCETPFTVKAEHVEWYQKKGLFLPVRCQPCLDKRKQKKSEVDEALSLDVNSSATPPLKLSMGKMSITIEVD